MPVHYVLSTRSDWRPGNVTLDTVSADELEDAIKDRMEGRAKEGAPLDRPIYVYAVDVTPWLQYSASIHVKGDIFN